MSSCVLKIKFRVLYRSRVRSEQPAVVGSIPELGKWKIVHGLHQRARCLPVNEGSLEGEFSQMIWESVVDVPTDVTFQWKWAVLNGDGDLIKQESKPRNLKVDSHNLLIHSAWQVGREVVIPNVCLVQVFTHYVAPPGFCIGIIGNTPSLGAWDLHHCILMDSRYPRGSGKWQASFIASNEREVEWKLLVINRETKEVLRWEERGNRSMVLCSELVKLEVYWGEGGNVRDTISQDFDMIYNTLKILQKAGVEGSNKSVNTDEKPEPERTTERQSPGCAVTPTLLQPSCDHKDEKFEGKKGRVFKVIVRKPSIVIKKLTCNTPSKKRPRTAEKCFKNLSPGAGEKDTPIADFISACAAEPEVQEGGDDICHVTCPLPEIADLSQKIKLMGYPENTPEKDIDSYYETNDALELMGYQKQFSIVIVVVLMLRILYEFYLHLL